MTDLASQGPPTSGAGFDFGQLVTEAANSNVVEDVPPLMPDPVFPGQDARRNAAQFKFERLAAGLDERETIVQQHKLIQPRAVDLLTARDTTETAQRVAPAVAHDPVRVARVATGVSKMLEGQADMPQEARLPAAQIDLAKVDHAIDSGLIPTSGVGNKRLRNLYDRFRVAPERLSDDDLMELTVLVKQVGDGTNQINEPDLSFEGGKIKRLEVTTNGVVPFVEMAEPSKVLKAMAPGMPLMPKPDDTGMYLLADGRAAVFGPQDVETATKYRNMYPALNRGTVSQWAPGRPKMVLDLEATRSAMENHMDTHQVSTWPASAWKNGHPATKAQHTIMVDLPDTKQLAKLKEIGPVEDPGMAHSLEGLLPPDPDPLDANYFEPDPEPIPQGRSSIRRRAVALQVRDGASIKDALTSVKALGLGVSAVYTDRPPAPGFTAVRDHVYQDQAQMMVVRTADTEHQSFHGFSAWAETDQATNLPAVNPDGMRRRERAHATQLVPGAWSVDGQAVLMLPPDVKPDLNLAKMSGPKGKAPDWVGMRFNGTPEVTPVWGSDTEPQGFDVVAKNIGGELTITADDDLELAAKFIDVMGLLGQNPGKVCVVANGEYIRTKVQ